MGVQLGTIKRGIRWDTRSLLGGPWDLVVTYNWDFIPT